MAVFWSANPEGDVGAVGSVQGPQVPSPWGKVAQGGFLYSFDFVAYTRDRLGLQKGPHYLVLFAKATVGLY